MLEKVITALTVLIINCIVHSEIKAHARNSLNAASRKNRLRCLDQSVPEKWKNIVVRLCQLTHHDRRAKSVTFNILVDVESKREMQISRRFDVAYFPQTILVPGHASWYHRFPAQAWVVSNGGPSAYIELNLSTLNASIRPVLVDADNFSRLMQGLPYYSWSLYDLGENATEVNIDDHGRVDTGINGITAMP